jgi:putative ABC transport system permease protein
MEVTQRCVTPLPLSGRTLHYAVRSLRKTPGFLAVVVFSLSLGVAANTTIFSVINAILYRPWPYPQPEELVTIWDTVPGHADWRQAPPIAELLDWQK